MQDEVKQVGKGILSILIGWGILAGVYMAGWIYPALEFLLRLQLEMESTGTDSLIWPVVAIIATVTILMILIGRYLLKTWWKVVLISGVVFFLSALLVWVNFQTTLGL